MYVRVTDGTPAKINLAQLRQEHPRTGFPREIPDQVLAEFNIFPCVIDDQPAYDPATHAVEGGPIVDVGGEWHQTWTVRAKTQEEMDAYSAAVARETDAGALKQDAQVAALLSARPNQINSYIDTNVTDLASAKQVLKILARALAVVGYGAVN